MASGTITLEYKTTAELIKICTALSGMGQEASPFKVNAEVPQSADEIELTPEKAQEILDHIKNESNSKVVELMNNYTPNLNSHRLRMFTSEQRRLLTSRELLTVLAYYVKNGILNEIGSITRDGKNLKVVVSHIHPNAKDQKVMRLVSVPIDNVLSTPRIASRIMDDVMREVGAIGRNESLYESTKDFKCSLTTPTQMTSTKENS